MTTASHRPEFTLACRGCGTPIDDEKRSHDRKGCADPDPFPADEVRQEVDAALDRKWWQQPDRGCPVVDWRGDVRIPCGLPPGHKERHRWDEGLAYRVRGR